MGCCNDVSVALSTAAPDPTLHVNYAKGMVLGVDDFTQEFAYLTGRDQWAVRELLGYGTTSGLALSLDDTAKGPRVRVSPGAAALPSGRLVCVPGEQCGVINDWLAKPDNAKAINALIGLTSPPKSNTVVSLYLTLCYADCLTLPVPIPGDPCRSEDQLMAPSRIADDYRLSFRTSAPVQTEEDAQRDFVAWLKNVPVVDTSPPPVTDEKTWMAALKAAVQPWLDAESASPPLTSPPTFASLGDYLFDSPPTTLVLAHHDLPAFMRVALRFWVTVLRPFWMNRICGVSAAVDDDCILLGRFEVPIAWIGGIPTGVWQVDGSATAIAIDETTRPILVSARLLSAV